jgi:hypothetical protein
MGFDLSVRFADPEWYPRNRAKVVELGWQLPSALAIEVSSYGPAFHQDVRQLVASLAALTDAVLIDEDGAPV